MKSPQEVITFKVDDQLAKLLKGIPNRSAFIRTVLLSALHSLCPTCKGTGVLTPHQKKHWVEIEKSITLEECSQCHSPVVVQGEGDS